ncbi:MAG TPA: VOC family protein [Terriglobales bacterium]|jgi:catechol 2,3-dioxygenase-like lactoylglutathione lyase family enzyme|nr:VOC family protein [Terriglobales bacterium]
MANTIRMEGLTLSVANVERSIDFYRDKLGLQVEMNKAPEFGMIRVGGKNGGTIGLLSMALADGAAATWTPEQRAAIHVELSTDDLDTLYRELTARGVHFHTPPHDEAWERCMDILDPDGYTVEIAEGRRGRNAPRGR